MSYVRRLVSGRLEYRRAFPNELRAHLGRRELIASLGAKGLAEPGAMERYNAANDDYERLVAWARKVVSGTFDFLDSATTAYLAEAFYAQSLELDDAKRWAAGDEREARWAFKTAETLDGILPLYRHLQATGDLDGIVELWAEEAALFAE